MKELNHLTYAVSVFFNEEVDQTVRSLWQDIAEAGLSDFLTGNGGLFHPHLTLAICRDIDVARFSDALSALATPILPVTLSSVGTFPGDEGVVFLAVTMTEALMGLHRNVHALLAEQGGTPAPYYLPDRWNPHCSVARYLAPEQIAPTVALCHSRITDSLQGTLVQIGITETLAEVELCRFDLGQPLSCPAE